MKLWTIPGGQPVAEYQGHEKPVWSVAFSPDGSRGVSGGYDQVIKVWDLATGKPIPAP